MGCSSSSVLKHHTSEKEITEDSNWQSLETEAVNTTNLVDKLNLLKKALKIKQHDHQSHHSLGITYLALMCASLNEDPKSCHHYLEKGTHLVQQTDPNLFLITSSTFLLKCNDKNHKYTEEIVKHILKALEHEKSHDEVEYLLGAQACIKAFIQLGDLEKAKHWVDIAISSFYGVIAKNPEFKDDIEAQVNKCTLDPVEKYVKLTSYGSILNIQKVCSEGLTVSLRLQQVDDGCMYISEAWKQCKEDSSLKTFVLDFVTDAMSAFPQYSDTIMYYGEMRQSSDIK